MRESGPGNKFEQKESPELFSASLGFDFIFAKDEVGKKRALCVEINGEKSGIGGIAEMPEGLVDPEFQEAAKIRDLRNPERIRRVGLANEITNDIHEGTFSVSPEAKEKIDAFMMKSIRKVPLFPNAFKNPAFIEDIATDKRRQEDFIPDKYAMRLYKKGDSQISLTGYWILKPAQGIGGKNIRILSNDEAKLYFDRNDVTSTYVIQEFMPPLGADLAGTEESNHPASMRFLIDFKYLQDGTIKPVFQAAYQRVSPYSPRDAFQKFSKEDIYVVNRARAAKAVPASEEEIEMAREAALDIIQKLGQGYKAQNSPQD